MKTSLCGASTRTRLAKPLRTSAIGSALLIGLWSLLPKAMAHGTHIWFVSPEDNAVLHDSVVFVVEAPYAKNLYIHLTVSNEGDSSPPVSGKLSPL